MFTMVNCTVKAIILETVAPQNKEQIKESINIFPGPQSQKESLVKQPGQTGALPAMVCSRGSLAATWPSLQCAGHHHCHANMYQPTLPCWSQSGWTYIHRIKIFVKVPTLLQSEAIKSGVSKLKSLFTPGLPDTGMLMVQGILSNT